MSPRVSVILPVRDAASTLEESLLSLRAQTLGEDEGIDVLGCRVSVDAATGTGMRAYVEWSNGLLDHDQIVRDLFVESPSSTRA